MCVPSSMSSLGPSFSTSQKANGACSCHAEGTILSGDRNDNADKKLSRSPKRVSRVPTPSGAEGTLRRSFSRTSARFGWRFVGSFDLATVTPLVLRHGAAIVSLAHTGKGPVADPYASDMRPGSWTASAPSLRAWLRGDGGRRVDCDFDAGFPGPGHQLVDPSHGMVRQGREHVGEPGSRIDVIELAGRNQ